MGEGSTIASSSTTVSTKRKAASGSGNASRSATPTNENGVSKKRPRSETPCGNPTTTTAAAAANASGEGGANDENKNSSNTNGIKKKKKTTDAPSSLSSSSSTMTFEEEIAMASSDATLRLLATSLQKLTDGIPNRELKLIVSEAKACETALEEELRILKKGLKLEQEEKEITTTKSETKTTTNNSSTNETKSSGDTESKNGSSSTEVTSSAASTLSPKESAGLKTMLESEFTPPDTHWTLSALLGRLRHELTTPLPPRSQLPTHREKQGLTQLAQNVGMTSQSTYKKRGARPQQPVAASAAATTAVPATSNTTANASDAKEAPDSGPVSSGNNGGIATKTDDGSSSVTHNNASNESSSAASAVPPSHSLLSEASQFKRLESLPDLTEYRRDHATPDKLLAVWKKLSTHRSSLVFRRPVNPKEAPGYTDRIRFPMDLSLIRKLVMSKHIKTYEGILKQVHLIGHNCVKYNGRESDYALVTREFESVATEYVWNAVMRETYGGTRGRWSRTASPMPPSSSSAPPASSSTTAVPMTKAADSAKKETAPATTAATTGNSTKS